MRIRAALAAVAIALAVPATGAGGEGDEEENESVTRVSCLGGIAELRLETEDDDEDAVDPDSGIAVALRVNTRRPVAVWRIVLLHERRIVFTGTRRSTGSGHSLRYARRVPDWLGRQTVAARLTAPRGRACRLEATI